MKQVVSVVVPSYNHSLFIDQCLDSIFQQSYRPIELIVVDDASNDGTWEKVQSWAQEKSNLADFTVKTYQRLRKGAAQNINFGLEQSTGHFLTILNSDDYFYPDRFMDFTNTLNQFQAELAMSELAIVDKNGVELPATHPSSSWYHNCLSRRFRYPTLGLALFSCPIHVTSGNFFFTRKLYKKVGPFKDFFWSHDYDFVLRCLIKTEPLFISKKLMSYRIHGSNTIHSMDQNFLSEVKRVYEDYFQDVLIQMESSKIENSLCPTPIQWPQHYAHWIGSESPIYSQDKPMLNALSFCFPEVYNNFQSKNVQQFFMPIHEKVRDSLKDFAHLHYLHLQQFKKTDGPRSLIKLRKVIPIKSAKTKLGCVLEVEMKRNLAVKPYLRFVGVFHCHRLIAICRLTSENAKSLVYSGFANEYLEPSSRNLKFVEMVRKDEKSFHLLLPSELKKNSRRKWHKKKIKDSSHGNLDVFEKDKFGNLFVHGWSIYKNGIPVSYQMCSSNTKIELLPELYERGDLKHMLSVPTEAGIAGFKYTIPEKVARQLKGQISVKCSYLDGSMVTLKKDRVDLHFQKSK